MCPASELSDGFEPTALFYLADSSSGECMDDVSGSGVPGVVQAGWVPGGVYLVLYPAREDPAGQIEAYFLNIKVKSVHTAV